MKQKVELDAVRLRKGWAIRPVGALGTCGWINGQPWTIQYVSHKPEHIPERKD